MNIKVFEQASSYKIAVLIKQKALQEHTIKDWYAEPSGLPLKDFVMCSLKYNDANKAPANIAKPYIDNMLNALNTLGVTTLLVCDSTYFVFLTANRKATGCIGDVFPCNIKGYKHINVILGVNYQSCIYSDDNKKKLKLSLKTLDANYYGLVFKLGENVIHSAEYPNTLNAIEVALKALHQYDSIVCDTETFALRHVEAGLGTIAFAWDKNNGIAFEVDFYDPKVRDLLRKFFTEYVGNIKYHNATFDIKILIYALWMSDITDHIGLIIGLDILTKNFDCTQVIRYLATNSCGGNKLNLKEAAHEFLGDYSVDVKDITKIPRDKLLEYNLKDCLGTWFVYGNEYPIVIADNQEKLYLGLMKETIRTLVQMELTGMPILPEKVIEAKTQLESIVEECNKKIIKYPEVAKATEILKQQFLEKDFKTRKEKAKNPENIKPKLLENISWEFNPNSGKQLAVVLYDIMGLPVLDRTPTKLPATGAEDIEKLVNHTTNQAYKEFITLVIDLTKAGKILSTFIGPFMDSVLGADGIHYIFGSFKLGGTVSGRLSSSEPNLQTIPSGSRFGKLIKQCFAGNKKWLFCGADFNALEMRIDALLTKDPNKLKVYLQGFDSHCINTYTYWTDMFPNLDPTSPDSINTIKKTHSVQRSISKPVSFALQYQGMVYTLIKNSGFSEEDAERIYASYHSLYSHSLIYTKEAIALAAKQGYLEVAFGLRIRTPVLAKTILGNSVTPRLAEAEGRTLGNAISQSFGLLNCRASNEFMRRVYNSEYKYEIKICAQIHDAIYLLVRNKVKIIKWVNDNLVDCMRWCELDAIKHDEVKLEAELDIFYPDWSTGITLNNNMTTQEITTLCS